MKAFLALLQENPVLIFLIVIALAAIIAMGLVLYSSRRGTPREGNGRGITPRRSRGRKKKVSFVIPSYAGTQAVYADSLKFFINHQFIPAVDEAADKDGHRLSKDKYEFGEVATAIPAMSDIIIRCIFLIKEKQAYLVIHFQKRSQGCWVVPDGVEKGYTFQLKGTSADDLATVNVQKLIAPFTKTVMGM